MIKTKEEGLPATAIRSDSCLAIERQIIRALHEVDASTLVEGVTAFLKAKSIDVPRHLVEQIPCRDS
jgi:hypothetical protein